MTPRLRRRWIGGIAVVALVALGILLSVPVIAPSATPANFDIQVVLGGNSRERSAISHRLWQERRTPVVVSGDGGFIYQELLAHGMPAEEMIHEQEARTTWQNAELSVEILRERKVGAAVIVTSRYHSARALSCFEKVAPEIEFSVCHEPAMERGPWERVQLRLRERCKRLAYAVMHGISPW